MQWTTDDVRAILEQMRIRQGDTASIEVKAAKGGLPKLGRTLCALANLPNGGSIILGVEEAGGRFNAVGVKDIAEYEGGLASNARNNVDPSPALDFQTVDFDGKKLVIAHVSPLPATQKPARYRGTPFLRQADGDYPMPAHEIRMLEIAKLHVDEQINYDLKTAVGRSIEDLSSDLVDSYLNSVRAKDRRLRNYEDERILQITNVLSRSGEPTLAGLYSLGEYPQGQWPALTVTAAVQLTGEGGQRNKNLQDFTGPISVMLEEIMEWVAEAVDSIHRYRDDGHMEITAEFPLSAVRELVANALVHRDLSPATLGNGKQIQIRLTKDRLFIQSPGGLRGVSLKQLESVEHAQAAVNQRLYQIAKRLKTPDGFPVIEGEGGGIREVFNSMARHGLARPQLFDTGVQFTATLWRTAASDRIQLDPDKKPVSTHHSDGNDVSRSFPESSSPTRNEHLVISELFRTDGSLTMQELSQMTGLSIGQVRYALARPVEEGVVLMEGGPGKLTHYQLPH